MKRIITTVTVLLFAFIATAQIAPFKIHNNKVYIIWQGDTLKLGVNPDSSVITGNNRLNMSHDSIYFPHLATGDTNILWVRGSDGKLMHLAPSDLCGDSSKWVRIKGSLRGRAGFSLNSVNANVQIFEECNRALGVIREWSLNDPEALREATALLVKHMKGGGL